MATQADTAPTTPARITPGELEQTINDIDPAAFLVEPRVLRRVIRYDRRLANVGLQIPHRKSYVIARADLLDIVESDELYPARNLPAQVILLPRPDPEQLQAMPRGEALLRLWRLLFHARVHAELHARAAAGELTPPIVRQRIDCIGQAEFDEIRTVLRSEDFLLPPRDDPTVYEEFAAVYWELRYFAPETLPRYFPGIAGAAGIEQVLSQDLDAAALFAATRPAGAPDPAPHAEQLPAVAEPAVDAPGRRQQRNEKHFQWLSERAERASELGNVVRSAILRERAAGLASPKRADEAHAAARRNLERLVQRLQAALRFDNDDAQRWLAGLWALLQQSGQGVWTTEARLLFDLQNVCVDYEREIYTVDLPEWAFSLGRRPIRRPLPVLRDVLACKHLRSAARRLTTARLPLAQRQRLTALVEQATHRAEAQVRTRIRPLVTRTLDAVQLTAVNMPERVARNKLTEELLDRVVERGFLRFGDLRDAVSRNDIKLPDITGTEEFQQRLDGAVRRFSAVPGVGRLVQYDGFRRALRAAIMPLLFLFFILFREPLLRLDRKLAAALDGVCHSAEIYLRAFQRFSASVFGSRLGRFVTRYFALPFGGAYVTLEGLSHLVNPIIKWTVSAEALERWPGDTDLPLPVMNLFSVTVLGVFILALIASETFRANVGRELRRVGKAIARGMHVVIELLQLPLIRRVLRSRPFLLLRRYLLKPLLFTALTWLLLTVAGAAWHRSALGQFSLFLAMNLLLNSRVGRDVEEITNEWIVRSWSRFRVHVLAGLYWLIVDVSREVLEAIDRFLYAVDEWLRFKTGERRLTFFLKAVLGVFWFAITYVVRFAVSLLLEPQVNPIKHFPVVTVSHKLLTAWLPWVLSPVLEPFVGHAQAFTIAVTIAFCIPGIFGFLVWELKENWRLYAANRARNLKPVIIGHHAETMLRFLKPGIHSGTLPKLYRRIRRAERKSYWTGETQTARKYLQRLEGARHALEQFFQREFVFLLEQQAGFDHLGVGRISTATNSVHVDFESGDAAEPLQVAFEEQSGLLLASVSHAGWTAGLQGPQAEAVRNALVGLYKKCGVDLVREQLEVVFPRDQFSYDISSDGLVVWPGNGYETQIVYDLAADRLQADGGEDAPPGAWPEPKHEQLLFNLSPVRYADWVAVWEKQSPPERLLPEVRVMRGPEKCADPEPSRSP